MSWLPDTDTRLGWDAVYRPVPAEAPRPPVCCRPGDPCPLHEHPAAAHVWPAPSCTEELP